MSNNVVLRSNDMITVSQKQDQPKDTVQMIRWLPGDRSTIFASGGWDGKLRVYEVVKKGGYSGNSAQLELRCAINIQIPILCFEWVAERQLYVGTADCRILEVDIANGKITEFAKPSAPVQEIKLMDDRETPAVFFFHMDERLTIYFPKATNNKTVEIKFQHKIVAADLARDMVLIAFDNCRILLCKVKDLDKSSHKYKYSHINTHTRTDAQTNTKKVLWA